LLGPYQIGGVGGEGILKALEVALAEQQDGVDFEIYTSDQPTLPTTPDIRGRFGRGYTATRLRARGGYLWVRLTNGAVTERWALEQIVARVAQGRRRVRSN
ncbi:MAG: hypothetical protein JSV86_07635, partial [Gemmatimonadota bacterium]